MERSKDGKERESRGLRVASNRFRDELCGPKLARGSRLETRGYLPKYFAFRSVYSFHFSGRSSRAKIADTGHTGTQAPQSMHSTGSIYSISSAANFSLSFLGWMQSTGQASTQAVSLVLIHGSAIT